LSESTEFRTAMTTLLMRVLLRIFLGWSVVLSVVAKDVEPRDNRLQLRGRHADFWDSRPIAIRQDDEVEVGKGKGDPVVSPAPANPTEVPDDTEEEEEEDVIPTNPPPSKDAWYNPPEGWEKEPVGKVLKTRSPGLPACVIKYCADTYQYMYRTSDTHGNASWSVTTVFLPEGVQAGCDTDPEGCSQGAVVYTIPYDSASTDATPSYLVQFGDPYGEMSDVMKRGWFLLLPDYEGPKAAFCDGPQAAYSTLDAVRGAREVGHEFGLRAPTAKWAIWGYSGGAFASGFAAEMAEVYAPELEFAGALIGGPSPNLTTACVNMNGQDTAGLVVSGLIGITAQWPAQRQWMLDHMHKEGPRNASGFMLARYFPATVVLVGYAGHDVYEYFINGRDDILSPTLRGLFDTQGQMGIHGIPNMLTFVYKAGQDEMSPIEETDAYVKTFCDGGANLLYHRNSIGSHNQELWSGRPRALQFLETVLDGADAIEVPKSGCMTVDVTVGLPDWKTIEIGTRYNPKTGEEVDARGNPRKKNQADDGSGKGKGKDNGGDDGGVVDDDEE
jgi:hypothetical protein